MTARSAWLFFDPGTFEEIDKLITHRCRDFGMEEPAHPGRRCGLRTWPGRRSAGVRVRARTFTVFGGSLSETNAGQNRQDHGPGDEDGRPRSSG